MNMILNEIEVVFFCKIVKSLNCQKTNNKALCSIFFLFYLIDCKQKNNLFLISIYFIIISFAHILVALQSQY